MKDSHAVIPAARGSACGSLQVLPKTRGPDFPRLRRNDVQRQIRYQKFSEWAMYIPSVQQPAASGIGFPNRRQFVCIEAV